MIRVIWYKKNRKDFDFEDFTDENAAIRFAKSLAVTGTECEICQLNARSAGCDA